MRCHGLLVLIALVFGTAAAAQTVGDGQAVQALWSPSHGWSAGFALQQQVIGPSALAELSGRQALLPGAAPAQASVLVVGATLRTGARSALSLQTPVLTSSPVGGKADGSEMQLAWSLRARDPARQFFEGGSPLKMAFSGGQTVVTLKPRASRVSITLQHRW